MFYKGSTRLAYHSQDLVRAFRKHSNLLAHLGKVVMTSLFHSYMMMTVSRADRTFKQRPRPTGEPNGLSVVQVTFPKVTGTTWNVAGEQGLAR